MAKNLTGAEITAKWKAAMSGGQASANYKAGIMRYQGNPMAIAASPQAEAKYLAKVTDSVTSGRRSAALNAVPVDRWRNNAATVGASHLSAGATKAEGKALAAYNKWAGVYSQAAQAAAAVADDGGANLGKVAAAIQVMRAAAGKA